jgi:Ca2+-binding RTX toxin-like protein
MAISSPILPANGGSAGDTIHFEDYGAGATLQHVSGNQWRIVGNGIVENITIVGAVTAGDYSFVGGGSPPPGSEPVTGTDGDDDLVGTAVADVLGGGMGNDKATGAGGGDWLYGGEGNDTLDGGTGIDSLRGGEGSDLYIVDSVYDFIQEQGSAADADAVWSALSIDLGNDVRFGSVENARLLGSAAGSVIGDNRANRLEGNIAANAISGNTDDDTLIGGDGNDTLDGGSGFDNLIGGRATTSMSSRLTEDNDVVEISGEERHGLLRQRHAAANVESGCSAPPDQARQQPPIHHRQGDGNELTGAGNDTLVGNGGDDDIDSGRADRWQRLGDDSTSSTRQAQDR